MKTSIRNLVLLSFLVATTRIDLSAKVIHLPQMPIETAIAKAKGYVKKNNIDVSKSYIAEVVYINIYEELQKPAWRIEWRLIAGEKGGQTFVLVYPDGKVVVQYGK